MTFEKWLSRVGYFPIPRIKKNYLLRGESSEFIQERVKDIEAEYKEWCSENRVEPVFKSKED